VDCTARGEARLAAVLPSSRRRGDLLNSAQDRPNGGMVPALASAENAGGFEQAGNGLQSLPLGTGRQDRCNGQLLGRMVDEPRRVVGISGIFVGRRAASGPALSQLRHGRDGEDTDHARHGRGGEAAYRQARDTGRRGREDPQLRAVNPVVGREEQRFSWRFKSRGALPGVFSGSARKRFASLVFSQFKNRTSGGSNRSVNIPHSFLFIARGTDPPDF
jgi:hypothetical protein